MTRPTFTPAEAIGALLGEADRLDRLRDNADQLYAYPSEVATIASYSQALRRAADLLRLDAAMINEDAAQDRREDE